MFKKFEVLSLFFLILINYLLNKIIFKSLKIHTSFPTLLIRQKICKSLNSNYNIKIKKMIDKKMFF